MIALKDGRKFDGLALCASKYGGCDVVASKVRTTGLLTGQTKKYFIAHFLTEKEARAAYPDVEKSS